ncbi:MAG: UDP-N-acetyl-D-glucosamine dehydrogenase, partial [Chloroflexaceae bacterium]|nr:UDP-N-acetyl-D-glucosamine dehydrogenase [Chloroflexaceae bacterium]
GVAYKKNVSDIRESPALDIIHLLGEKGATVSYHDPMVPTVNIDGLSMTCVPDLFEALRNATCVVIVTDHSWYDWDKIRQHAALIVDTRRAIRSQDV